MIRGPAMRNPALLVIFLGLPAIQAHAAEIPDAVRTACMVDYRVHCAGIVPGGGRMIGCFVEKAGALSQPCRAALSETACNAAAPDTIKRTFPCPG